MLRVLYPLPEKPPQTVKVEGPRFHYLVHVLRVAPGQEVEVFDGRGRAFRARVEAVDSGSVRLRIGSSMPALASGRVSLIQAVPKSDKMEWILQKGTELGAAAFAPVETARSVVRLRAARARPRLERWRKVIEEAARQCGRADVPQLMEVAPVLQTARAFVPEHRILVLDEMESEFSLAQALLADEIPARPVALAIGPEGGWERSEIEALKEIGASAVSLGRSTLRVETAAIAALTVVLHLEGQLG
jgi:16S rRNA (uracil1498-N3)-methyltransferase